MTGRHTIVMNAGQPVSIASVSLNCSHGRQTYQDVPSSERQIDGLWIPHCVRSILLRLPEHVLQVSMPSIYRLRALSESQESHPRHELLLLEIDHYPMRTQLREARDMLKMTLHGEHVFGDPRSQEILRRIGDANDSIEVVASMATIGMYYIATLSRFQVEKLESMEGEHEEQQCSRVTLLNGYVRVFKRGECHHGVGVYDLPAPEGAVLAKCEHVYVE